MQVTNLKSAAEFQGNINVFFGTLHDPWTILSIGDKKKLVVTKGEQVFTTPLLSYRNGHGKPGRKGGSGHNAKIIRGGPRFGLAQMDFGNERVPAACLTQELINAIAGAEGVSADSIKEVFDSFYDEDLGKTVQTRRGTAPTPRNDFPDAADITFFHLRTLVSTKICRGTNEITDAICNIIKRNEIKPVEINGKSVDIYPWPMGGVTLALKMKKSASQPVSGDLVNIDFTAGVAVCAATDLFNKRVGCKIAYERLKMVEKTIANGGTVEFASVDKKSLKFILNGFGVCTLPVHKDNLHINEADAVQVKSPYFPKGIVFSMSALETIGEGIRKDLDAIAEEVGDDYAPLSSLGLTLTTQYIFGDINDRIEGANTVFDFSELLLNPIVEIKA